MGLLVLCEQLIGLSIVEGCMKVMAVLFWPVVIKWQM